jgi:hypothetical protein
MEMSDCQQDARDSIAAEPPEFPCSDFSRSNARIHGKVGRGFRPSCVFRIRNSSDADSLATSAGGRRPSKSRQSITNEGRVYTLLSLGLDVRLQELIVIHPKGRRSQPTARLVLFVRHGHRGAVPLHLISSLLEQPTILFGQSDRDSGRRHARRGRSGSDRGVSVTT